MIQGTRIFLTSCGSPPPGFGFFTGTAVEDCEHDMHPVLKQLLMQDELPEPQPDAIQAVSH
jgi:hypothetical protein